MHAELELLRMLTDSDSDIAADRIAPVEDTFRDLRSRLLKKNNG